MGLVILGRQMGDGVKIPGSVGIDHRGGRLHDDFVLIGVLAKPVVERTEQSVKRLVRTDRQKDHRTDPRYLGPSGFARCSHCVSQRSACLPRRWPERESSPALAMLSIQTVLAPRNRPIRRAK